MNCMFSTVTLISFLQGYFSGYLNEIADVATIIGLIVLPSAYLWKGGRNKKHAINATLAQLEVMKGWTRYKEGGYPNPNNQESDMNKRIEEAIADLKNTWGNPLSFIFPPENNALNNLFILPAIAHFSKDIVEFAITYLSDCLVSMQCGQLRCKVVHKILLY